MRKQSKTHPADEKKRLKTRQQIKSSTLKSDESLNHHSVLNRKCGDLKLMENFHNNAG